VKRAALAIAALVAGCDGVSTQEHYRVRQELEAAQAELGACRDRVAAFEEAERAQQERVVTIIAEATAEATEPPPPEAPPVLVPLRSRVRENSIGTPELQVTVRNETDDTIDAFRFMATCFNEFDELQLGRIRRQTEFHGYSDDTVRPHQERSLGWWALYDFPLCSRATIVITEVHFTSGERWRGAAHEPQPSPD
jgi:hypothetical protein